MERMIDVGIVGAGPYGLSLAAHLRQAGVTHRVFGKPMQFWRDNVPHGTCLKSDGESSDLIDPDRTLSIARYFAETGRPFAVTNPIPVEAFTAYGQAFQAKFAPDAESCDITRIRRDGELFCLTTSTNETVLVRHVVLALGVGPFRSVPEAFARLPASAFSHSSEYGSVAHLAGRRVAVIGSGASAIDVAAVAHEAGAQVTIISGRDAIAFHSAPARRRLRQKIRRPDTGIGAGWSHWFYVNGPDAFRLLPKFTRLRIVTTALGPAPGWFMKDRILGRVPVLNKRVPVGAAMDGDTVRLDLQGRGGERDIFFADHIIAATGFRVDMSRLEMLDAGILAGLRLQEGAPVLSSQFETSVPGLYAIGPAAAFSFGPVMRFVYGAEFAVPRVAGHLVRECVGSRRRQVSSASVGGLVTAR